MKLAIRITAAVAFFLLVMASALAGMGLIGLDFVGGVQVPYKALGGKR